MPIALMLATLTDSRDFSDNWLLGHAGGVVAQLAEALEQSG